MNWNKLFQQFIQKQNKKSETTAEDVVRLAVQEIEKAIEKNKHILQQTLINQSEISQKIINFQHQIKTCEREASLALQRKQEAQARELISQKITVEKQMQPFVGLLQNINHTVQQLESQIAKLEIQAEETKSKEIILKAKLESAKTQQELTKQLNDLDMQHLDLFEQEVTQIELENKLMDNLLSLENEFESLETQNHLSKFENEFEEAKQRQQKEAEENQFKIVNQLFTQDAAKEKILLEEKKKALEERKNQLLDELINSSKNIQKPSINHQADIIEDFFNTPPNDQQKKIDDFFNN